jgi:large subunit ribosomal protein L24
MANIRKGDLVQVISGPTQERGGDRGKQGRVITVIADKNRVVVEGVNFVTKHVKVGQTQRGTKTGGIETMEAPIHVSNVALVDPETKLPARVGFKEETDDRGKTTRVRFFKPSRRVETKKSKALKGDAAAEPKASEKSAAEKPAAEKAPKAAPKAKKDAAAAAPEKDAE